MLAFESSRARRALGGVALGACSLFWPAFGWAQAPAVEPPPPEQTGDAEAPDAPSRHVNLTGAPAMDLSTPAPPPPVAREYHQHEGFYLRLGGGIGALAGSVDTDTLELESAGVTLDGEALMGFSPAPGLALGAGAIGSLQLSGDWELKDGGGSANADLTTLLLGLFADGFPEPKKGWHAGGMLGLAIASFEAPGGENGSDALGVGGALWGGYDVWVAPEWSIGGALRLEALRATNAEDDATISALEVTFAVSVLYH
jgi:hypothetical protein